jgi:hypothetical protein
MAVFSVADMSASFTVPYRRKISQIQRKCPTLRILAQLGALKEGTTGEQMRWIAKTSGQVAGNVSLDGGSFLTAASDVPNACSLAYGTYEAPAKVTDGILWDMGPSSGIPGDMNAFDNVMMEAQVDALEACLKLIEQHLYIGSGSSNQMTGLSTGVADAGAYAGLTHADWVATETLNSGTLRSLTIPLMKTHLRTIANASKAGRPNLGLCPPAIMDAIEALFDPYLSINTQMGGMPGPARERMVVNPGSIQTVGGTINMDGFRHFHWATAGVYFVEAPDCTYSGQTNANNGIFFLNTNELALEFKRPPGPRLAATDATAIAAVEQDMGAIGGLLFERLARPRVDHSMQWDLTTKVGLQLLSRNAHGWLGDVQ